jgi:hypothetical protein
MLVKIGEEYFDSKKQPIMLVFESDDERNRIAHNLMGMMPRKGERKYCFHPAVLDRKSVDHFMEVPGDSFEMDSSTEF